MRRPVQVLCIAAAVLAAGGALWAIASSDLVGRYTQLGSQQPASSTGQRLAAIPKTPDAPTAARPAREDLSIEVARIDAGGSSVFAGRSAPDHRVTVLANGREIGSTIATEDGQWAIVIDGGIDAGPLELGIKSRSVAGGAEVVGAPRQLVVPGTRATESAQKQKEATSPKRTASAEPATGGTGSPAATKTATSPAPASASSKTIAATTAPSQAQSKGAQTADQKALEQFASIVAKEREAARAREATSSTAATAMQPTPATQQAMPSAAPAQAAPRASETGPRVAAAAPPAHRQEAIDSEPGRYAASRRAEPAAVTAPIPVPITFVSGEARLTDNGARAAALLAEYLRLKAPAGVTLSGHADARGPDGYNMRLSLRRLDAIQRYLRAAGYAGKLSLVPRGKRDPYQGIDRRRLSLRDIHQADRRVELQMTP